MELPVFPIHKKREYLMECCKLINSEWKRSVTARLRSLESSCNSLPVNLILLKENEVIGHAKLSKIPTINNACYVESVVIKNELRGQGYGSYLMNNVEKYCENPLKLNAIYLSTTDQQKFYQKLGYVECEPIQLFGSPVTNTNNLNSFKSVNKGPTPPPMPKNIFSSNTPKTYMCKYINYIKE